MRERESINKRALKANIAAFITTTIGIALAWLATGNINVWATGIWGGIRNYLLALIIAALPLRWHLLSQWGGANYARTLAIIFCARAAIDIAILVTYSNTTSAITPAIIATAICALFALISIKTPKTLAKLRAEEEEKLEYYTY